MLATDTPGTTAEGNPFVAPAGWRIEVRGRVTVLEPLEANSQIVLVDVKAPDADTAVEAAWAAFQLDTTRLLKGVSSSSDTDGWSNIRDYSYQTSPNEGRDVSASVRRAGDMWTVVLSDMDRATRQKRSAQVALVLSSLLPKGFERETFIGKPAHRLDAARITELTRFVEEGREALGVPGVSVGVIQDGSVVLEAGFGVRDIDTGTRPDADTLYLIASNTKVLTTLLLAKLVDEGRLTWNTPVTGLLPAFELGDPTVTNQVLVKHLVCACTGLPRQDLEAYFQYEGVTAQRVLRTLATMKPTTGFGETYQYSNLLAAAAGFVGGHVAFPTLELGAAYDKAMQTRVFRPLSMTATTFDFARALAGNHAAAHAPNIHGFTTHATMALNYALVPIRPAGGAWSNVRDMLKYVQMELDAGTLPGGLRYIARDTLFARRTPQVSSGRNLTYGMGLEVDTTYGVPIVHHGGSFIGYHSDMIWLPQHRVGAVILTNGDPGWAFRDPFRRKLLEMLFDGRPEANAELAAQATRFGQRLADDRKRLTIPAAPGDVQKLAPHYWNDALGEIVVRRSGAATIFDFGEWKSEVASRDEADDAVTFVTVSPGVIGNQFVVGSGPSRTLIVRDPQHEYVFTAVGADFTAR